MKIVAMCIVVNRMKKVMFVTSMADSSMLELPTTAVFKLEELPMTVVNSFETRTGYRICNVTLVDFVSMIPDKDLGTSDAIVFRGALLGNSPKQPDRTYRGTTKYLDFVDFLEYKKEGKIVCPDLHEKVLRRYLGLIYSVNSDTKYLFNT